MSAAPEAVGVLGGTFDPVHEGHLHLAAEARRILRLSHVLMVVAASPPHKRADELTEPLHRSAMLDLALEGRDGLESCTIEIERHGPSYTIETLRRLREGPPEIRPVFILGWDALLELPTWRSWRSLVTEFEIAVADRTDLGSDPADGRLDPFLVERLVEIEEDDPGAILPPVLRERGGRIYHLPVPMLSVSSSRIRQTARQGHPLDRLVPPLVARYIRKHRLYV